MQTIPDNLWKYSHRDHCCESRNVDVDERGECYQCWEARTCIVFGCPNHAHELSEGDNCSACELVAAIERQDFPQIERWVPLVNADQSLRGMSYAVSRRAA